MWLPLYSTDNDVNQQKINTFETATSSWKDLPHHKLWRDDVYDEFSLNWKTIFEDFPFKICIADAYRFLILQKYGGIYVDLDVMNLRTEDEWTTFLQKFPEDVILTPELPGIETIYNGMMISKTPEHPFWSYCLSRIAMWKTDPFIRKYIQNETGRVFEFIPKDDHALRPYEITGPRMLYQMARDWNKSCLLEFRVRILDSWMLHPVIVRTKQGWMTIEQSTALNINHDSAMYFSYQETKDNIATMCPNSMSVVLGYNSTWKPMENNMK